MNEIKRFIVSRQINDVFNTRNEFSTIAIHDFSLNSSILMFWKNVANHANTGQKSYNLLKMKKESAIIEFQNESTKFKIISIKSFYRIEFEFNDNEKNLISDDSNQINQNNIDAIERNDFIKINQKKNFKSAKCIERYVSHQIIKFAVGETRSKKIEKIFRWNQFHYWFRFLLFHKSCKRIDWRLFQSINQRLKLFFNWKFVLFISIHWFKTEKNQRFIKKKNFRIRQQTRYIIRHSCFQRTFHKWN